MDKKPSKTQIIITIPDYGDSTQEDEIDYIGEMMSYLDANYNFDYKIIEKCYCENGIFYFTKDNLLKDSKLCGKCDGMGWIDPTNNQT